MNAHEIVIIHFLDERPALVLPRDEVQFIDGYGNFHSSAHWAEDGNFLITRGHRQRWFGNIGEIEYPE